MGLCLARRRGQEKIVDDLEKSAKRRGEVEKTEMIEKGTNGQSECMVREAEVGISRGVKSGW